MEIKKYTEKARQFMKKYVYVALVLAIGFVLMMLPNRSNGTKAYTDDAKDATQLQSNLEDKLSMILSKVDGAGDVRVVLSVEAGEEILFQTNDSTTSNEASGSGSSTTVTVTDAERREKGLVRQVIPEVYQGAIIVCSGADDPRVKLEIVDAVSKATGLGANKISVLKMK